MNSVAVLWICIGGALAAIVVLVVLRMGRTPTPGDDPGSRTGASSGDADQQDTHAAELDPDDERVAFADRRRYPATKWDPTPDDPDDVIDEDDRSAADRPRHPTNRWERD